MSREGTPVTVNKCPAAEFVEQVWVSLRIALNAGRR